MLAMRTMSFFLGDKAMQLKADDSCQSPEESFFVHGRELAGEIEVLLVQVENHKVTRTKKDQ